MAGWVFESAHDEELARHFGSLDAVFALTGERISCDPLSEVIRIERGGIHYYVKRYTGAGKGLRRYVGRPRVKAEWQNLKLFERLGIPTAPLVAYGLERNGASFSRGALITRELPGTQDLAQLASSNDPRLGDRRWVEVVSRQVAEATRMLHLHRFAHNDLKWRNLLVDEHQRLFLIDCPTGSFWHGPLLTRRIIKDLACLDKVAKYQLTRTQRLRFYLQYVHRNRLNSKDKQRIRQITSYFLGRE